MFVSPLQFLLAMSKSKLLWLVCFIIVTGCTQVPQKDSVKQYFSKSNGATITTLAKPFSFYRQEPLLAANSRDYIYVGPVEINEAGQREYVLWLYYCSTIDRDRPAATDVSGSVFLIIDDTPMELVQAHNVRLAYSADGAPYAAPVAGGYAAFYRVTQDQLRHLAQAGQIRLVADARSQNADEYTVWSGAEEGFRLFASYLRDDVDVVFASIQ